MTTSTAIAFTADELVKLYRDGRSLERQGGKKVKAAILASFNHVQRDQVWIEIANGAELADQKAGNHNEMSALRMRIRECCLAMEADILTVKRLSKDGLFQVVEADKKATNTETKLEKAFKALAEADATELATVATANKELILRLAELLQANK